MADKRMIEADVVAQIESGMTIGIGGWGARRKPMSIIRELLRSDVDDLTVVSYGGPDVGMLCRAGKVSKLVYAFVSLDDIPLEPHFRAARQSTDVEFLELDEGQILLGLQAAAWRVPFLPTRVGLGSDLMDQKELATITSPFDDGEVLVAVPALPLDAALLHLNLADVLGNTAFLGPDLYFDDVMAQAASHTYVSVERVVPSDELVSAAGCLHGLRIGRLWTSGIVERAGAAAPTSCEPDYPADWELLKRYAATAGDPAGWESFWSEWVMGADQ
ncbi:MAG TPA: CoA-transferase [Acidimicrobiales bacterium]|jgi:glutaconate CoA-transferase subunit A